MTTDNKTLADVQPGGRVRLGDALLPCPFCGNDAEFVPYKNNGLTLKCKSMGCIQRHQRTLRYGIDWLRTSMTEHWNARVLSAQPSPGGQGDGRTINKIARGLLADQMVGHARHVFTVVGDDEIGVTCGEAVRAIETALAARQPVAVDLERARDEGHDGAIRYVLGYLNGVGDCGSTAYDEILNACGRERIIRSAVEDGELEFTGLGRWVEMYGTAEDRALIDSKAVGNG